MRRFLRDLFFRPDGEPRLVAPAAALLLLTFLVGYGAMRVVQRSLPAERQASALSSTRKYAAAEAIYMRLLHERPDGKTLIALLENHQRATIMKRLRQAGLPGLGPGGAASDVTDQANEEAVMTEEVLDDFIGRLPLDLATLGRYWRGIEKGSPAKEVDEEIRAGADRDPPVAFFNHALGRDAMRAGDAAEAAKRFEREGLAFPNQKADIDQALVIWMRLEAWDHIHDRMADPRVASAASAMVKYQLAVHDRDWLAAGRFLVVAWRPNLTLTSGVMSGAAALAWFFFCARLGKLGEKPKRRLVFYLLAFGLGVLSLVPTVFLIAVEEAKLRLVATGDVTRDLLFYVFGVGLREEGAKILLFLPLLPILRKWGDRLDVLVCGALVGLGFAAEENLNYLASGDLHTSLGRFLTANFLHMALTGTLAAALDDFLRDREKHATDFSRTSLLIVAIHGGYDFLLSHEEMGGSYVAMAVFFFLVRMFLGAVDEARRKADRGITLTHAFMLALAVVTGTSAVYSVSALGPVQGVLVLAEGLLGAAILVYAFVRTLRGM